jgi:putative oxidoreductase
MADRNRNSVAVDLGLLIMRLGIGAMFLVFGWQKLQGGTELWEKLGGAMKVFGVTFKPVFWGFMAMFAELVGGAMLIIGLFVRPYALLLLFTMVTASVMLITSGSPMQGYAHAVDMAVVFAGLLVAGGGRYALGAQVATLDEKWWR